MSRGEYIAVPLWHDECGEQLMLDIELEAMLEEAQTEQLEHALGATALFELTN